MSSVDCHDAGIELVGRRGTQLHNPISSCFAPHNSPSRCKVISTVSLNAFTPSFIASSGMQSYATVPFSTFVPLGRKDNTSAG